MGVVNNLVGLGVDVQLYSPNSLVAISLNVSIKGLGVDLELTNPCTRVGFTKNVGRLRVKTEVRLSDLVEGRVKRADLAAVLYGLRLHVQTCSRCVLDLRRVEQAILEAFHLNLCGLHSLTSISSEKRVQTAGGDFNLASLLLGFSFNQTTQGVGLQVKEGLPASVELRVQETDLIVVKVSLRVYSYTSSGFVCDIRGVDESRRSVVDQNLGGSHGSGGIGLNGTVPGLSVDSKVGAFVLGKARVDLYQLVTSSQGVGDKVKALARFPRSL
jgi:hypothetical protein